MNDSDVVHEFLIESAENLARLDLEMVGLEQRPQDRELLSSIFRTIHTIKGTCGFLAFGTLEAITHGAENLLRQLRTGQNELTPDLVPLILETVDATRCILANIEATGSEGPSFYEDLRSRLDAADKSSPDPVLPAGPGVAAESAGATGPPLQKAGSAADSTIRVDVGLLDKLGNLVGELVLTRNQILQFNAQYDNATLNATSQHLNLITSELQEGVMKTRMQPIDVV